MARAIWNGAIIAESGRCEIIEGNCYFPPEAVRREYLEDSEAHTECPWKGTAHYYDLMVNGQRNRDAAWYYPDPKPAARQVKDYVAFWRGVTVAVIADFCGRFNGVGGIQHY